MLIENPDLQTYLADNPQKITTFVEEVLRLNLLTQGMDRHTIEDVELSMVSIPKGAHIHMPEKVLPQIEMKINLHAQLTLIWIEKWQASR